MQFSERKTRYGNFIPPYTPGGRLDPHSARSGKEQTSLEAMAMQLYKGYLIDGDALMVHPFSPDWYVGGNVYVSGHSGSIVGITRFRLHQFTVSMKELAEWFGLEIARIVVDECLAQARELNGQVPDRSCRKCDGYPSRRGPLKIVSFLSPTIDEPKTSP
jgi:hypothetical protein